jgi:hypothetical protein
MDSKVEYELLDNNGAVFKIWVEKSYAARLDVGEYTTEP